MKTKIALLLAALAAMAFPAWAATPVPGGKWSFVFTDKKGHADRPIRIYTYRPRSCDSTCPIQFVLHGSKRDASAYRDHWELLADRYKFLVIAPEFSQKSWPRAAAYNLGDVNDNNNAEKWAFSAIEHIFDEMRDGQADYRIFGHSAGGQFVQRMLFFRPDARISAAMVANPGVYTFPEWRPDKTELTFPFSFKGSKIGEAQVRSALARRVVLLIGENDTDPDDENLNQSEGAKKQGPNRLERGENFFKSATSISGELGIKFGWELVEVPVTTNEAGALSKAAAAAVWGPRQ